MTPFVEVALILSVALLLHLFFDRLISKIADKVKGHPVQRAALEATTKPLPLYIWLFALVKTANALSQNFLGYPIIQDAGMWLKASFWVFFAWFLFRWKHGAVVGYPFKVKTSRDLIDKTLTIFILFITLVSILDVTGQSMATLIAFGGVSGLAIAFASQQVIANFFGGLMIYMTHPFTIGEWIRLPEKDVEGHVEEIGWYMTLVRGLDKRPIYVPNSIFSSVLVMNPSRMSHREILEIVGVRYADIPKVPAIMAKIKDYLKSNHKIDKKEKILAHLDNYSPSAVDIKVQCFTKETDSLAFQEVKQEVLFKIAAILEEEKAELAYPTEVHHIKYDD